MQPVNVSTTVEGSNESHGVIGSSDGTLERENCSVDLYPERTSLNVIPENLEEDASTESLPATSKLRSAVWKQFAAMAVSMVEKFEKYWDIANKLLEIATILDPRYKMKSIENYYGLLYDTFVAELKIESARKSFSELFDEYSCQATPTPSDANTSRNFEAEVTSCAQSSSSLAATRLGLEKFIFESNSSRSSKSELEVYFEDTSSPGIGSDSIDILAWWR